MRVVSNPRKLFILLGVGALVVVAVGLLGVFRVAPGRELLIRRGTDGEARVVGAGWHWMPPWASRGIEAPSAAVDQSREVGVRSREGAEVKVRVAGRFGVVVGGEGRYAGVARGRVFSEVVWSGVEQALAAEADALVEGGVTGTDVAGVVARELGKEGIEATGLEVTLPREANPAVAAQARRAIEAVVRASAPGRHKVLVVGWDAADWLILRPLIAAGRMPNLAKLIAHGPSGELRSEQPLLSPIVWTTLMTGRTVFDHGISDFVVRDPATGEPMPVTSRFRKVHALWTILSAVGLRCDVVGLWATWPAETINGTMVTDRVSYQLFGFAPPKASAGLVYPPEAWAWIKPDIVTADAISYDEVHRFVDIDRSAYQAAWESLPPDRRQENKINHLRKVLAATRTYEGIALGLLKHQADLTIVYFEGTDTVAHLFARDLPPQLPGVSEDDIRRFGHAIPEYYLYIDSILGKLVAAAAPDTEVIVLSDHGFFTGQARPDSDPSNFEHGAARWHRLEGMIAGGGPGLAPSELADASIYDVTPTVLAILGLPVPQDMPGRVLTQFLPSGVSPPAERIASYEVFPHPGAAMAASSPAANRERLRELVALGYLSPGDLAARPAARPTPTAGPVAANAAPFAVATAPSASPPPTGAGLPQDPGAVLKLATAMIQHGRIDEAKTTLERTIAANPSYGPPYLLLAQIAHHSGAAQEEFQILARYFTKADDARPNYLSMLVDAARRANSLRDATTLLALLRQRFAKSADLAAAAGWVGLYEKNTTAAGRFFEEALQSDPVNAWALLGKIDLLRWSGHEDEARSTLEHAADAAGRSVIAMQFMAGIAFAQQWNDLTEKYVGAVLKSDPDNPRMLAYLGFTRERQKRADEALPLLVKAAEMLTGDAGLQIEVAKRLTARGRAPEALRCLDRATAAGVDVPALHYERAAAFAATGDVGRARAEAEKVLAERPGDPAAQALLARLGSAAPAR
jgi:predicted AlkP superfamily phosphohydrolase/phosphomutase/tetratricopeptide (TPR) repeat protein